MTGAMSALEAAIKDASRLETVLKDGRPRVQVTLTDERNLSKATALAWFSNYKGLVISALSEGETALVDEAYKAILESSERAGARSKYLSLLKKVKKELIRLQSDCAVLPPTQVATVDKVPDFAPLISDPVMQGILVVRWRECTKCLEADVSLAATVMMGGLLEGLLLARINRETDKKRIYTAKAAPKDYSKKVKPLSEWMLKDFIEVVHELGWISVSAKDVGAVLRDYRNYIHPQKQLSHGVHLKPEDAKLFWEVSKSIARQIIDSAKQS
jgi:hypothetical protein